MWKGQGTRKAKINSKKKNKFGAVIIILDIKKVYKYNNQDDVG